MISNSPTRVSAKAMADRVVEMEIARVVIKAKDKGKEMAQAKDWGLDRSKRTKLAGLRRVSKARLAKVRRL